MNLKERGITVGDLLLFIIILFSIFVVLRVKQSQNDQSAQLDTILIHKINIFDFDKRII